MGKERVLPGGDEDVVALIEDALDWPVLVHEQSLEVVVGAHGDVVVEPTVQVDDCSALLLELETDPGDVRQASTLLSGAQHDVQLLADRHAYVVCLRDDEPLLQLLCIVAFGDEVQLLQEAQDGVLVAQGLLEGGSGHGVGGLGEREANGH